MIAVEPETRQTAELKAPSKLRRAYNKLAADNLTGHAAMLAFNLIFSILAFLLLLSYFGAQLLNDQTIVNQVLAELDRIFPGISRTDAESTIHSIRASASKLGIFVLIFLIWTGSSLWSMIDSAINQIYSLPRRSFMHKRLQGLAITVILVFFFALAVILASLAGVEVTGARDLPFGLSKVPNIISYISLAFTWAIAAGLLAFIYSFGPNTRSRWHEIWLGTVFGSALITALTLLFPAYISLIDITRYGAAFGFVVLILTWLYLVSLVILLGAEVNAARRNFKSAASGGSGQ